MANNHDREQAAGEPTFSTIHLRFPEFWPTDPILWFAQVEAHFANHRVNSQMAKFNFVVAALPPVIAMVVRDMILKRPEADPYDKLKAELTNRTSALKRKRLQELLTSKDLGDRKPSQLLRRMEQLVGDKHRSFDESFLRELFIQRMPSNVNMILASASEDISLQALARMAGSID